MEYACPETDLGPVAVLWPGLPLYVGTPPYLPPEGGYVYVGGKPCPPPGIRVHPSGEAPEGALRLDTPEGFWEALKARGGLKVSEREEAVLRSLPPDLFWRAAKAAAATGRVPKGLAAAEKGSVYALFRDLFLGFDRTYERYHAVKRSLPHGAVFQILSAMMAKTANPPEGASPAYRALLQRQRPYLPTFRRAALRYAASDMAERDFLTFLFELDPAGSSENGPCFP